MRKYGLLAVAAGLALSGSVAKADFVITSSRVALTGTTDQVTFQVQDTFNGTTAGMPFLQSASVALYAPTSFNGATFANNGLFINASFGAASVNGGSLSNIAIAGVPQLQVSPDILALNGTLDTTGSGTYTSGQQVAGIGLALATVNAGVDATTAPITFAVAVVPTGDPVEVLQTTATADAPGNRTIFPTFQPTGTEFTAHQTSATGTHVILQANNNTTAAFSDPAAAVPEPASLGLIGLAMGGLLSRRRRSA